MPSDEPTVRTRPFEAADVDAVNDLLATHYPWTEYETTYEVEARQVADAGEAVVATVAGSFAGFVWWLPGGAFGRSGYVRLVGVHRDHQTSGVGSVLMDAAERTTFVEADRSDLFLLVSAFNERARSFYERRGYVEVGRLEGYVEAGVDEVLLRLSEAEY